MKAIDIKFRCSSLGHLMTEATQAEKNSAIKLNLPEPLSAGTKTHLIDVFVKHKYNRFSEIHSKFLDKGNDVEEDSITMVSLIRKRMFEKNEVTLTNDFISGTPDLSDSKDITKATEIIDTKSSWDIFTYSRSINKPLNPMYYWQGVGYMALTGAKKCSVIQCLTNTPYHIVEGELRRESYNHANGDTPTWMELQIIANHVYDKKTFDSYTAQRGIGITGDDTKSFSIIEGFIEIPLAERFKEFQFDYNPDDIKRLYERIMVCRSYMDDNFFK